MDKKGQERTKRSTTEAQWKHLGTKKSKEQNWHKRHAFCAANLKTEGSNAPRRLQVHNSCVSIHAHNLDLIPVGQHISSKACLKD